MKTRTPLSLLAAAWLTLSLAGAVQAQPVQDATAGISFSGEVTAVDAAAKTLSVKGANGEAGVFHTDAAQTTIMNGSQKVGFSSLQVGEWIVITANQKGEKKVASYIEVVSDPNPDAKVTPLATAAGSKVAVSKDALTPALTQVGAGQSVTFTNSSKVPLTVVASDGSFSSPALKPGDSWSHTINVPGVYPINVKENAAAKGSIVVE